MLLNKIVFFRANKVRREDIYFFMINGNTVAFHLKVESDVGQDDPTGIDDQWRDLVSDGLKFLQLFLFFWNSGEDDFV